MLKFNEIQALLRSDLLSKRRKGREECQRHFLRNKTNINLGRIQTMVWLQTLVEYESKEIAYAHSKSKAMEVDIAVFFRTVVKHCVSVGKVDLKKSAFLCAYLVDLLCDVKLSTQFKIYHKRALCDILSQSLIGISSLVFSFHALLAYLTECMANRMESCDALNHRLLKLTLRCMMASGKYSRDLFVNMLSWFCRLLSESSDDDKLNSQFASMTADCCILFMEYEDLALVSLIYGPLQVVAHSVVKQLASYQFCDQQNRHTYIQFMNIYLGMCIDYHTITQSIPTTDGSWCNMIRQLYNIMILSDDLHRYLISNSMRNHNYISNYSTTLIETSLQKYFSDSHAMKMSDILLGENDTKLFEVYQMLAKLIHCESTLLQDSCFAVTSELPMASRKEVIKLEEQQQQQANKRQRTSISMRDSCSKISYNNNEMESESIAVFQPVNLLSIRGKVLQLRNIIAKRKLMSTSVISSSFMSYSNNNTTTTINNSSTVIQNSLFVLESYMIIIITLLRYYPKGDFLFRLSSSISTLQKSSSYVMHFEAALCELYDWISAIIALLQDVSVLITTTVGVMDKKYGSNNNRLLSSILIVLYELCHLSERLSVTAAGDVSLKNNFRVRNLVKKLREQWSSQTLSLLLPLSAHTNSSSSTNKSKDIHHMCSSVPLQVIPANNAKSKREDVASHALTMISHILLMNGCLSYDMLLLFGGEQKPLPLLLSQLPEISRPAINYSIESLHYLAAIISCYKNEFLTLERVYAIINVDGVEIQNQRNNNERIAYHDAIIYNFQLILKQASGTQSLQTLTASRDRFIVEAQYGTLYIMLLIYHQLRTKSSTASVEPNSKTTVQEVDDIVFNPSVNTSAVSCISIISLRDYICAIDAIVHASLLGISSTSLLTAVSSSFNLAKCIVAHFNRRTKPEDWLGSSSSIQSGICLGVGCNRSTVNNCSVESTAIDEMDCHCLYLQLSLSEKLASTLRDSILCVADDDATAATLTTNSSHLIVDTTTTEARNSIGQTEQQLFGSWHVSCLLLVSFYSAMLDQCVKLIEKSCTGEDSSSSKELSNGLHEIILSIQVSILSILDACMHQLEIKICSLLSSSIVVLSSEYLEVISELIFRMNQSMVLHVSSIKSTTHTSFNEKKTSEYSTRCIASLQRIMSTILRISISTSGAGAGGRTYSSLLLDQEGNNSGSMENGDDDDDDFMKEEEDYYSTHQGRSSSSKSAPLVDGLLANMKLNFTPHQLQAYIAASRCSLMLFSSIHHRQRNDINLNLEANKFIDQIFSMEIDVERNVKLPVDADIYLLIAESIATISASTITAATTAVLCLIERSDWCAELGAMGYCKVLNIIRNLIQNASFWNITTANDNAIIDRSLDSPISYIVNIVLPSSPTTLEEENLRYGHSDSDDVKTTNNMGLLLHKFSQSMYQCRYLRLSCVAEILSHAVDITEIKNDIIALFLNTFADHNAQVRLYTSKLLPLLLSQFKNKRKAYMSLVEAAGLALKPDELFNTLSLQIDNEFFDNSGGNADQHEGLWTQNVCKNDRSASLLLMLPEDLLQFTALANGIVNMAIGDNTNHWTRRYALFDIILLCVSRYKAQISIISKNANSSRIDLCSSTNNAASSNWYNSCSLIVVDYAFILCRLTHLLSVALGYDNVRSMMDDNFRWLLYEWGTLICNSERNSSSSYCNENINSTFSDKKKDLNITIADFPFYLMVTHSHPYQLFRHCSFQDYYSSMEQDISKVQKSVIISVLCQLPTKYRENVLLDYAKLIVNCQRSDVVAVVVYNNDDIATLLSIGSRSAIKAVELTITCALALRNNETHEPHSPCSQLLSSRRRSDIRGFGSDNGRISSGNITPPIVKYMRDALIVGTSNNNDNSLINHCESSNSSSNYNLSDTIREIFLLQTADPATEYEVVSNVDDDDDNDKRVAKVVQLLTSILLEVCIVANVAKIVDLLSMCNIVDILNCLYCRLMKSRRRSTNDAVIAAVKIIISVQYSNNSNSDDNASSLSSSNAASFPHIATLNAVLLIVSTSMNHFPSQAVTTTVSIFTDLVNLLESPSQSCYSLTTSSYAKFIPILFAELIVTLKALNMKQAQIKLHQHAGNEKKSSVCVEQQQCWDSYTASFYRNFITDFSSSVTSSLATLSDTATILAVSIKRMQLLVVRLLRHASSAKNSAAQLIFKCLPLPFQYHQKCFEVECSQYNSFKMQMESSTASILSSELVLRINRLISVIHDKLNGELVPLSYLWIQLQIISYTLLLSENDKLKLNNNVSKNTAGGLWSENVNLVSNFISALVLLCKQCELAPVPVQIVLRDAVMKVIGHYGAPAIASIKHTEFPASLIMKDYRRCSQETKTSMLSTIYNLMWSNDVNIAQWASIVLRDLSFANYFTNLRNEVNRNNNDRNTSSGGDGDNYGRMEASSSSEENSTLLIEHIVLEYSKSNSNNQLLPIRTERIVHDRFGKSHRVDQYEEGYAFSDLLWCTKSCSGDDNIGEKEDPVAAPYEQWISRLTYYLIAECYDMSNSPTSTVIINNYSASNGKLNTFEKASDIFVTASRVLCLLQYDFAESIFPLIISDVLKVNVGSSYVKQTLSVLFTTHLLSPSCSMKRATQLGCNTLMFLMQQDIKDVLLCRSVGGTKLQPSINTRAASTVVPTAAAAATTTQGRNITKHTEISESNSSSSRSPYPFSYKLNIDLVVAAKAATKCQLVCTALLFTEIYNEMQFAANIDTDTKHSGNTINNMIDPSSLTLLLPIFENIHDPDTVYGIINLCTTTAADLATSTSLDVQALIYTRKGKWMEALCVYETMLTTASQSATSQFDESLYRRRQQAKDGIASALEELGARYTLSKYKETAAASTLAYKWPDKYPFFKTSYEDETDNKGYGKDAAMPSSLLSEWHPMFGNNNIGKQQCNVDRLISRNKILDLRYLQHLSGTVFENIIGKMADETSCSIVHDLTQAQHLTEINEALSMLRQTTASFKGGTSGATSVVSSENLLLSRWNHRSMSTHDGAASSVSNVKAQFEWRIGLLRWMLETASDVTSPFQVIQFLNQGSMKLFESENGGYTDTSFAHSITPLIYEFWGYVSKYIQNGISEEGASSANRQIAEPSSNSFLNSYWSLYECKLLWAKGLKDAAISKLGTQVVAPLKDILTNDSAGFSSLLPTLPTVNEVNTDKDDHVHNLLSEAMCLRGEWVSLKRTAMGNEILEDYLNPAVQHARGSTAQIKSYAIIASYHARLYYNLKAKVASLDWLQGARVLAGRRREYEECRSLQDKLRRDSSKSSSSSGDGMSAVYDGIDVKALYRHLQALKKELELDSKERDNVETSVTKHLMASITNFTKVLQLSSDVDFDIVFQIVQLWLDNSENSQINILANNIVNCVPSYKFVPLAYQLMSRLGGQPNPVNEAKCYGEDDDGLKTNVKWLSCLANGLREHDRLLLHTTTSSSSVLLPLSGNAQDSLRRTATVTSMNSDSDSCSSNNIDFQFVLCRMILKLTSEHPYHMLPQLFALVHERELDRGVARTGGTSDTTAATTSHVMSNFSEQRLETAKMIVLHLKTSISLQHQQLVTATQTMLLAYIDLANTSTVAFVKQGRIRGIKYKELQPRGRRFNEIISKFLSAAPAVLTSTVPLSPTKDYSKIAKITSFAPDFSITESGISRPKIIRCIGSDGRVYVQLVKGGDDMRQDAVMQQVFEYVNYKLNQDNAAKYRSLGNIRTYKIVPTTPQTGVLEWVPNVSAFGTLLYDKTNGSAHPCYYPSDWNHSQCRQYLMEAVDSEDKLKRFREICAKFHPAFRFFFLERFCDPVQWLTARLAYTRSTATNSIIGYILGIGDRHAHNILIDTVTAEVVHIDFGIVFDQGKGLGTPETVPFRLTRDIVDGMGITACEGSFRRSCEEVLRVLRGHSLQIMTILEVVIHDPLYKWSLSPLQARQRQNTLPDFQQELLAAGIRKGRSTHQIAATPSKENLGNISKNGFNTIITTTTAGTSFGKDAAERTLNRVLQKLQGHEDCSSGEPLSIEGQVDYLINEARNDVNLSRLFPGWAPWL